MNFSSLCASFSLCHIQDKISYIINVHQFTMLTFFFSCAGYFVFIFLKYCTQWLYNNKSDMRQKIIQIYHFFYGKNVATHQQGRNLSMQMLSLPMQMLTLGRTLSMLSLQLLPIKLLLPQHSNLLRVMGVLMGGN